MWERVSCFKNTHTAVSVFTSPSEAEAQPVCIPEGWGAEAGWGRVNPVWLLTDPAEELRGNTHGWGNRFQHNTGALCENWDTTVTTVTPPLACVLLFRRQIYRVQLEPGSRKMLI